jgi:hypothetical protein
MDEKDSSLTSARRHGGARAGAGRPRGSTDKITARLILEQAEQTIGKPFLESLMEGYRDTILDGDRRNRVIYEKIIVDKVATTLLDVEVTESEDVVQAKREAFAAAIAQVIESQRDAK